MEPVPSLRQCRELDQCSELSFFTGILITCNHACNGPPLATYYNLVLAMCCGYWSSTYPSTYSKYSRCRTDIIKTAHKPLRVIVTNGSEKACQELLTISLQARVLVFVVIPLILWWALAYPNYMESFFVYIIANSLLKDYIKYV